MCWNSESGLLHNVLELRCQFLLFLQRNIRAKAQVWTKLTISVFVVNKSTLILHYFQHAVPVVLLFFIPIPKEFFFFLRVFILASDWRLRFSVCGLWGLFSCRMRWEMKIHSVQCMCRDLPPFLSEQTCIFLLFRTMHRLISFRLFQFTSKTAEVNIEEKSHSGFRKTMSGMKVQLNVGQTLSLLLYDSTLLCVCFTVGLLL